MLIKPYLVHVYIPCWHILIPTSQAGVLFQKEYTTNSIPWGPYV